MFCKLVCKIIGHDDKEVKTKDINAITKSESEGIYYINNIPVTKVKVQFD